MKDEMRDCFGECGAKIAATPGNYYCAECVAEQTRQFRAEREAFNAFHAYADSIGSDRPTNVRAVRRISSRAMVV